jgi:GNAT superfamily N-acetyltransferase
VINPAASANACNAVSIRAHVPSRCHRRNRPPIVCRGPYRAGTSRHGAPTRPRHRIPSISCRLFHFGGRPGFLPAGSNGCSTAHCSSVRSARAATDMVHEVSGIQVFLVEEPSTGDLATYRSPTRWRVLPGDLRVRTSHAVAHTWNGEPVTFQPASPAQAGDVLDVLNDAAAWLAQQGIRQWPARFQSSWIEAAIHHGETWLVTLGDTVAGTITLDWADPIWNDTDGSAGYVHRMAVRRSVSGLGTVILSWARDTARRHGRHALRLDCVASNHRLRTYYETAGFVHRGDVAVGGAPGQRLPHGPTTLVSRYEQQLDTSNTA